MPEKTRAEHLQWCKDRAMQEYDYSGRPQDAIMSMASDLEKHPETAGHLGVQLGLIELMGNPNMTREQVKRHIEGYN